MREFSKNILFFPPSHYACINVCNLALPTSPSPLPSGGIKNCAALKFFFLILPLFRYSFGTLFDVYIKM